MRKINPNLLKLAEMTRNPDLKMPLEESFDVIDDSNVKDFPGYIYVPSIKVYVAEKRSLNGKNWFECHRELHKQGKRMLTLHEYAELLIYLKDNPNEINNRVLDEIVELRKPGRAEWIDAYFEVIKGKLRIDYGSETINGELKPKYSEVLEDYLGEVKRLRIDLNLLIKYKPTRSFPCIRLMKGNSYAIPILNNTVASIVASSYGSYFCYDWLPNERSETLGVRAARGVVHKLRNRG